jgi:hypothetical protein
MRLDVILAMHAERRGRHSTKISMRKMPQTRKTIHLNLLKEFLLEETPKLKMLSTVTGDRAPLYVV